VHRAPLVAAMRHGTIPNKLGSQSLVLLHTQGEMQGLRDQEDSGPSERRHGRACKVPCDLRMVWSITTPMRFSRLLGSIDENVNEIRSTDIGHSD